MRTTVPTALASLPKAFVRAADLDRAIDTGLAEARGLRAELWHMAGRQSATPERSFDMLHALKTGGYPTGYTHLTHAELQRAIERGMAEAHRLRSEAFATGLRTLWRRLTDWPRERIHLALKHSHG